MGIGYTIHPTGTGTRKGGAKMKKGITKQEFINKYSELLRMIREDINCLQLYNDETVVIQYKDGFERKVSIACNSGIATIRDIAKVI